jgi:hypothetical protein
VYFLLHHDSTDLIYCCGLSHKSTLIFSLASIYYLQHTAACGRGDATEFIDESYGNTTRANKNQPSFQFNHSEANRAMAIPTSSVT